MFALVSPAKKLDFETACSLEQFSLPSFEKDIDDLIAVLQEKSKSDLADLMHLSDKLAELNYDRYQKFSQEFNLSNAKQALYAFQGDTYVGLDAKTLSVDDVLYSQNSLGILSGLYGLLRPLDLIQPYRLEMGTKLTTDRGKNLYEFWGDIITNSINDRVSSDGFNAVVNLASNEYIKAVNLKKLDCEFINIDFKETKNGQLKTIGIFAKRARGMMARYIIENQIKSLDKLMLFNDGGYEYSPEISNENKLTFVRP